MIIPLFFKGGLYVALTAPSSYNRLALMTLVKEARF